VRNIVDSLRSADALHEALRTAAASAPETLHDESVARDSGDAVREIAMLCLMYDGA
jgi:hypothetical protein